LANRAEKDKIGQETLETEINNYVSQPRKKECRRVCCCRFFSISESDSNVHSMMHQLFKTHDVFLEHRRTFETIETI
jgi:hypothetical protein